MPCTIAHSAARARFGVVVAAAAALAATLATGDGRRCVAVGSTLVVGITSDLNTLFPWKATQFQAIDVLRQHLRHAHRARPEPRRRARPRRVLGGLRGRPDRHVPPPRRRHLRTTAARSTSADVEGLARRHPGRGDRRRRRAPALASVTAVDAPDPADGRAHAVGARRGSCRRTEPAPSRATSAMLLRRDDTEEAAHTQRRTAPGRSSSTAASPNAVASRLVRNDAYWGDAAAARRRRVPGHPRRGVDRGRRSQSGNVQLRGPRRPARRRRPSARRHHRRRRRRSSLPRAPAQRPRRAARQPQRAPRHPVRHRPPGGARHRRARRGRGHRSDHVAGLPVATRPPARAPA